MPFERSKEIVRLFERELIVYQRVLQDERTPNFRETASSFGYRLLVYAVRFIPGFMPRIGHLEDTVIMTALVFAALRFVPRELVSEHREQAARDQAISLS